MGGYKRGGEEGGDGLMLSRGGWLSVLEAADCPLVGLCVVIIRRTKVILCACAFFSLCIVRFFLQVVVRFTFCVFFCFCFKNICGLFVFATVLHWWESLNPRSLTGFLPFFARDFFAAWRLI